MADAYRDWPRVMAHWKMRKIDGVSSVPFKASLSTKTQGSTLCTFCYKIVDIVIRQAWQDGAPDRPAYVPLAIRVRPDGRSPEVTA